MSSASNTPVNAGTGNAPLTFPVTVVKQLEFRVENEEDYRFLQSTNEEDDFIADMKASAEQLQLVLVSIDGVKFK